MFHIKAQIRPENAYRYRDQQAGTLDLAHVGDAARLVRVETSEDLPAGADDAHVSVIAAEEQAIGAGAYAGDLVVLEEGARLVVAGLDLADLEEVECFPLRNVRLATFGNYNNAKIKGK